VDGDRLLVGLDAEQRRAVIDPGQPLCILAGAGSGKTRVLTRRIAHRSLEGSADPRFVLALTFTRKAATEMAARLGSLGLRDRPTVGTFHGIAWSQVRAWCRDRGRPVPTLLESKSALLRALPARTPLTVRELTTEIEWARARQVAPSDYPAEAHRQDRQVSASFDQVAALLSTYEQEKRRRGLIDFDDILTRCAGALEDDPTFGAAQRWRFRHLFVDEFQDVNALQHRLLRGWLGERPDLCVVGDPNQAIYRWNGADAGYLTHFAQDNPGATIVELTGSYRSTPQILHLAGVALGPLGSARVLARRAEGEVPTIRPYATDLDEANGIARQARLGHPPGARWDRQAVLVRTNEQMTLIQQALAHARIPCRLRGADPLLRQPVVRDALRLVAGDATRPLRAGLDDLQAMLIDLAVDVEGAPSEQADALGAVLRLGRDLLALEPQATAGELRGWLASAAGADGPGHHGDAIDVVTFHAAKGLEWPVVFVPGLEDGLVPVAHARTPEAEAEERRLLHVAITRAEDELHLSWAAQRTLRGREARRRPSPFLADLEAALVPLRARTRPVDPRPGLIRARSALSRASAGDDRLVVRQALEEWRAMAARRAGIAPAVVLSDRMLADVARARPADEAALATVRGVGPMTLDTWGPDLLAVVARHRPQPLDPVAEGPTRLRAVR